MRKLNLSNLWGLFKTEEGAREDQLSADTHPPKSTNEFNLNNLFESAKPTGQPALHRQLKCGALFAIALIVSWLTAPDFFIALVAIEDPLVQSSEQDNTARGQMDWFQVAFAAQSQQNSAQQTSPLSSPLTGDGLNRSTQQNQSPLAPPADAAARQGDNQLSPLETPTAILTATQILTPTLAPTDTPTVVVPPTDTPAPTDTPTEAPSPTDTPAPTHTTVPTATATTEAVLPPPTETPEDAFVPEDDAMSRSMAEDRQEVPNTVTPSSLANSTIPVAVQPATTTAAIDPLGAIFTTEAVILGLLCLIFLSINGLGVAALVVTLLYIRSRREQPYP